MNARLLFFLLTILTTSSLHAQQPAANEPIAFYNEAIELFDKGKYGAAQEQFADFLDATRTSSHTHLGNDLRTEAEFYSAVCAYHLLRNNAQALFSDFITNHPNHPKVNEAWYYSGKLYYVKREYADAVPMLQNVVTNDLDAEKRTDTRFMLGWCYYQDKKLDRASTLFASVMNVKGEHQEAAAFYYALIQYEAGNYGEALKAFEQAKANNKYAGAAPQYIANCLLKLKRYDELDVMGEELLSEGVKSKSDAQIYLTLANASYERERYSKALEYFSAYSQKGGKFDREMYYRVGFCNFKAKNYEEARSALEKTLRPEDEVAQNASFLLGQCFMKMENYENARLAFGKAESIKGNPEITEEAMFLNGKISFQTRYFDDALSSFQGLIKKFPDSRYKGESEALIGEILLYSGRYQEAIEFFEKSPLKNERSQKAYQIAAYSYALDLYKKNLFEKSGDYFKKGFNLRYDKEITQNSYFWYAEGKFRQEDYKEAVNYYEIFLDQPGVHKNPYHTKAWYGLGWAYFSQGKLESASRSFSKYLALADKGEDPELYVDALLRAGDCEFVAKKYDNALKYYLQVRDRRAQSVDYSLYQIGQCYHRKGQYQQSVDNLKTLVNNFRKSEYRDDALMSMADTYLNFLSDWGSAAGYANKLITDYPKNPLVASAYNVVGTSESYSNQNEKAIKAFKVVVNDYWSDEKNSMIALENLSALMAPNDYDKVLSEYQKKNPKQNEGLCDLVFRAGQDRFYAENYPAAIEQMSTYIQDCPGGKDIAECRYIRGQSYEKTEKVEKALQDYELVYNTTPLNDFSMQALNSAGELQFAQGKFLSSIQLFLSLEELADGMEDKLKGQFGRAKNYMAMEDYKLAMDVYMGIFTDPNTTQYSRDRAHVQIGVCKYFLKNYDEALEIFTEIDKNYTNVFGAESQYWKTKLLFDQGKYAEAKEAGIALKDKYTTQHYWRARVFLVVAEADLAMGDSFQAKGNLERLSQEDRFPEIQKEALRRLREIIQMEESGDMDGSGDGGGWDEGNPQGSNGKGLKEDNQ
ncbi:MAG: tetratricopeptide repeat protein [Bacteroidia bacterium]|nr:tetratricopeptide repeat protein [Bacteroidia bacterium]